MAGGKTTKLGRASGEEVVAAAFAARGVPSMTYEEWKRHAGLKAKGRTLVRECHYTTLYQTDGRVDFVLYNGRKPEVSIEVKHQGASGSCDEKVIYVVANGLKQWPTTHGVLVLSGAHWTSERGRQATIAARRLAAELASPNQQFDIFDLTAVTNWIARAF